MVTGSVAIEYLRMHTLKAQLPRAPGGVLGELIGGAAHSALGFTGATLFLLLLFGVGFSLFFHVSWLAVVERIGGIIESAINGIRNLYAAHEDRKVGQVAAVKREETVVQERAKIVEAPPIRIEPQVVAVPKSERVEKEKQVSLFADLPDTNLPPLSLLDEPPPAQETGQRRDAGIHQPPDREEAVRLRRRGEGGRRLSGPGHHALRDRAGDRRQGQPDRQPRARPRAFAVADVDPRGRNHSRQESAWAWSCRIRTGRSCA